MREIVGRVEGAHNGRSTAAGSLYVQGTVLPSTRPEPAPPLPDRDVRLEAEQPARRYLAEAAHRAGRLLLLLSTDIAAATGGVLLGRALLSAGAARVPAGPDAAAAGLLLFLPVTLGLCGGYGPGTKRAATGRVLAGVALSALLVGAYGAAVAGPAAPAAAVVGAYAAAAAVLVAAGRLGLDRAIAFAYDLSIGQRQVLVVGTPANAALVERFLASQGPSHLRVVGRLSPADRPDDGALGTIADMERALRETGARGIVLASGLPPELLESVVRRCADAGAVVSIVSHILLHTSARIEVRPTPGGQLIELYPRRASFPPFAVKRAVDIALSLVLLAVLSPLMLLIAAAIKLDSRGPVLFKQVRAGLGGRPFGMYKFRTMVCGADEMKQQLQHLNGSGDPRLFKIRRDPRVTRVGKLLRRVSLDELPQLLNVLRGEMSLVGPRPFFPEDIALYEPHHFERLSVLPGITGLWQVSGRSDVADFEEVVRLDSQYIRGWSLWLDLWILLRTVPAAFARRGAY